MKTSAPGVATTVGAGVRGSPSERGSASGSRSAPGVGVAVGAGVATGVAVGAGVAVAAGVGVAVAAGDAVGSGLGVAAAGVAVADGAALPLARGGGAAPPPLQPAVPIAVAMPRNAAPLKARTVVIVEVILLFEAILARRASTKRPGRWMLCGRGQRYGPGMKNERASHPGEESFVVRIRSVEADPERWRATVVHVGTGERRYVGNFAELRTFIESRRRRADIP